MPLNHGFIRHPITWIVLVSTIIIGLLFIPKNGTKSKLQLEKTWPVQVENLKLGTYQPEATIYGQVSSHNHATLKSSINADVLKVFVKEGQHVNKHQKLVTLDKSFFELDVKEIKSELERLKAQIKSELIQNKIDLETYEQDKKLSSLSLKQRDRYQHLKERNLGSHSQFDEADKNYLKSLISLKKTELRIKLHKNKLNILSKNLNKARSRYQKALINLDDTIIKAPFSGNITKVFVSHGDRLSINSPILSLYSHQSLEIRAQVSNNLRIKLMSALNNKAPIKGIIDHHYQTQLSRIESEIEQGDSSVDAFFSIDEKSLQHLPLGQAVEIKIKLPPLNNVYLIPAVALFHGNAIYWVKHQRLKRETIHLIGHLEKHGQEYYIIKGNKSLANKQIIITKIPFIRENLKVDIVK